MHLGKTSENSNVFYILEHKEDITRSKMEMWSPRWAEGSTDGLAELDLERGW